MIGRLGVLSVGALALVLSAARTAVAEPTKDECASADEGAQSLVDGGKLRDARAQLLVCIVPSCPAVVRDDCAQRLHDVDAAMPTVIIDARDASGTALAGVRVLVDGAVMTDRLDGTAVAVDPGTHRFRFEAANRAPVERLIEIAPGTKERREHVTFDSGAAASPTHPAETARTEGGLGTPKLVALGLGGLGAIGLVIGIVAGIGANSWHATLDGECMGNNCPATAQGDLESFHSMRTVSTIGYVIGAAAVAAGAVLWFTGSSSTPKRATAAAWVGPGSAGLSGTF